MKLIIESPIVNQNCEILQESRIGNFDTVKFKALLMEADTVNRNGRLYPKSVLQESIKIWIEPRLSKRNFGGELDHPVPTGTNQDIYRQQTMMWKYASHIITELWWEGNKVFGIVETLPTPNGQILANLIRFNVEVGFSLRALGDVRPSSSGVTEVYRINRFVAIDAVNDPSFKTAVVVEVMQEQFVLNESFTMSNGFCYNGICFENQRELYEYLIIQRFSR